GLAALGRLGGLAGLVGFRRFLQLRRALRTKPLREAVDAALGIDELLATREERVARVADVEVQLVLGRARGERIAARAADGDFLVSGVNPGLHSELLGKDYKRAIIHRLAAAGYRPEPRPARP